VSTKRTFGPSLCSTCIVLGGKVVGDALGWGWRLLPKGLQYRLNPLNYQLYPRLASGFGNVGVKLRAPGDRRGELYRPFADSIQLNKELIEPMYRGNWNNGKWVSADKYPGGLAGAIRREIASGEYVGGVSHIEKGQQRLAQMKRILEDAYKDKMSLSDRDLKIVRSLHDDLQRALGGK
jgi:hypothetical protein